MGEEHTERDLKLGLIKNIRQFLLEMGGDFTFIGNQYKIEIDPDEIFYIDLLLYHRRLRSLVAIELKKGKFRPEHSGKMQFYLSVLNDRVKLEDENPSIGIIICQSKNRTTVEYALKDMKKPIGVANYTLSKTLPEKLKQYLPSPEEFSHKIDLLKNKD